MQHRGDDSALMHLDFAIIDIFSMQLSCMLMYWATRQGRLIYTDPIFRMLAFVVFTGQMALGLSSDNYHGIQSRDAYDEFFKLLLYTLDLSLVCVTFIVLMKIPIKPSDLLLMTIFFLDIDFFTRQINKALHSRFDTARRQVVVVTSGELVRQAIRKVNESRLEVGHEIIAVCVTDDTPPEQFADLGIPVFRTGDPELLDKLVTMWIDDAFFLFGAKTEYHSDLMGDFMTMGITVHYSLSVLNDFTSANTDVQTLGDYKTLTNSARFISYRAELAKRMMDILGGLVGVIATGLLCLFVAPAIYIKSPGPIFFKQKRVGRNGKTFYMYKFRSMYMDAEKRKAELMATNKIQDGMMFKMDDDPRIIGSEKKGKDGKPKGIGNFIRNTSIDEFPQFFNVLKGDMSLVGTRPPTMDEWEKYAPHHRVRMAVKPGITGMWQVSGRSQITDFEEVVALDRRYLEHWSVMLDIRIILRTVKVVLSRDGAS